MTKIKLIAILVALILTGSSIIGAYFYGRSDGTKGCKADAAVSYQEGVKRDANIDRHIDRMGDPDIDRVLSRWVQ